MMLWTLSALSLFLNIAIQTSVLKCYVGQLLETTSEEPTILKREMVSLTGCEFLKKCISENFHKKKVPSANWLVVYTCCELT